MRRFADKAAAFAEAVHEPDAQNGFILTHIGIGWVLPTAVCEFIDGVTAFTRSVSQITSDVGPVGTSASQEYVVRHHTGPAVDSVARAESAVPRTDTHRCC